MKIILSPYLQKWEIRENLARSRYLGRKSRWAHRARRVSASCLSPFFKLEEREREKESLGDDRPSFCSFEGKRERETEDSERASVTAAEEKIEEGGGIMRQWCGFWLIPGLPGDSRIAWWFEIRRECMVRLTFGSITFRKYKVFVFKRVFDIARYLLDFHEFFDKFY